MAFKDYFSKQASAYQQFRPVYPKELYNYLASLVSGHTLAWDCATGNGQAAVELINYFAQCVATDISLPQLKQAKKHKRIIYALAPAEQSPLTAGSVDLITVAQALHWFNFASFYQEVHRVCKKGGILAAWSYPLMKFSESKINELINDFYQATLGQYWPAERKYIDNHYQDIPFPFAEIKSPQFTMDYSWDMSQVINYIETWSAVQRYKDQHGTNPVQQYLVKPLSELWGLAASVKPIQFDLILKVGKV